MYNFDDCIAAIGYEQHYKLFCEVSLLNAATISDSLHDLCKTGTVT